MTPPVPVLLLDVDGVVNCFPIWSGAEKKQPENVWGGEFETFEAKGYTICFAPKAVGALLEIHTAGLAEIRWLTTWAHHANELLCKEFGFPEFEVVAGPDYESRGWWKWPHAVRVREEVGAIIWADDDLGSDRDALSWARMTSNVLPIIPDSHTGLTPAHFDEIRDFCESVTP
jgi:hypothetical protein